MSHAQDLGVGPTSACFSDLMSSYLDGSIMFGNLVPFLRVDTLIHSEGALGVPSVIFCMQVRVPEFCLILSCFSCPLFVGSL